MTVSPMANPTGMRSTSTPVRVYTAIAANGRQRKFQQSAPWKRSETQRKKRFCEGTAALDPVLGGRELALGGETADHVTERPVAAHLHVVRTGDNGS